MTLSTWMTAWSRWSCLPTAPSYDMRNTRLRSWNFLFHVWLDQWSSPSFPFSLGWRLYPCFVGLTIGFSYCLLTWSFSAQPPQSTMKIGPSACPFNRVYVFHSLSAFTVCKRVKRVVIFCYLMREWITRHSRTRMKGTFTFPCMPFHMYIFLNLG